MNNVASQTPPSDDKSVSGRKRKFNLWQCFWLTFLVVSLAFAWYSFYVPANEIVWADSYDSAKQESAESGKPVILYFTGTWCSPCRIMRRQVWADKEVMALVNAQFVPVSIDVDASENSELMTHYQIKGPPVTIVCDAQENVLDWRAGGIGKTEFLEFLKSSSSRRKPNS